MNKGALFSIVATLVFALFGSLIGAASVYSQPSVPLTLTPFDCDNFIRTAQLSDDIVAVLVGNLDLLVPDDGALEAEDLSFQIRPGADEIECDEPAPPLLILRRVLEIESDDTTSTVVLNGNPVEFNDTIAFQLVTETNNLQLIVLSGNAAADDVAVEALFTIQILLTADGTEPLGVWLGNRPISEDDLANLDEVMVLIDEAFNNFVTTAPVSTRNITGTPCTVSTNSPRYIILAGDTLSDIAARASTTLAELMRLNCLDNANRIIAGQPLYVPRIPIPRPTATFTPSMTFTVTFAATEAASATFTVTFPGTAPPLPTVP